MYWTPWGASALPSIWDIYTQPVRRSSRRLQSGDRQQRRTVGPHCTSTWLFLARNTQVKSKEGNENTLHNADHSGILPHPCPVRAGPCTGILRESTDLYSASLARFNFNPCRPRACLLEVHVKHNCRQQSTRCGQATQCRAIRMAVRVYASRTWNLRGGRAESLCSSSSSPFYRLVACRCIQRK